MSGLAEGRTVFHVTIQIVSIAVLCCTALAMTPASAGDSPVLFTRGIMQDIQEDEAAADGEQVAAIEWVAAQGEFEPFSLAVRSGSDGVWEVHISPLEHVTDEAALPASSVEVALLEYGKTARYHVTDWILHPATTRIFLTGSKTARLWLSIRVPEDAEPGHYRGNFVLRGKDGAQVEVPMRLEVLPFRHEPAPGVSFYLLSTISPYGQYFDPETKMALKPEAVAFYRELKDHGMVGVCLKTSDWPYRPGLLDGLKAEVEAALEAGLQGPVVWNMLALINAAKGGDGYDFNGRMDNWNDAKDLARLREIHTLASRLARENGWPDVIYYPIDEAGTQFDDRTFLYRSFDILLKASRLIGQLGSRAHSTITEMVDEKHNQAPRWSTTPDEMRGIWDGIRPYLHIRNYGYGYPQGKTNLAQEMADAKKRGFAVWIYNNTAIMGRDRYCARGYFGLWGWKAGVDGLTAWTYPGGRTLQWELVREGIDDYRYLATLERLIEQGRGSAEDRAAARRFLEDLRASIPLDGDGFVEDWAGMARQATAAQAADSGWEFIRFKNRVVEHIRGLATVAPMKDPSAADFDRDGDVDFGDFLAFALAYGAMPDTANWNAKFDIDGNLEVDFGDFLAFAEVFGRRYAA